MSKTREDIITRVRKLLNLAKDSAAAEGEVANAMSFAKKLMDEYDLSEADVLLKQTDDQVALTDIIEVEAFARNNQLPVWYISLHEVIITLFDVRCMIRISPSGSFKGKRYSLVFYGLQRDAAMAVMFYNELRVIGLVSAKMAAAAQAKHFNRTFERSYFRGFVRRLVERAQQIKATPAAVEPSVMGAIVLRKNDLLDKYALSLNLCPGKANNRRSSVDMDALLAGRSAADKVDLTPADRKVSETQKPVAALR